VPPPSLRLADMQRSWLLVNAQHLRAKTSRTLQADGLMLKFKLERPGGVSEVMGLGSPHA